VIAITNLIRIIGISDPFSVAEQVRHKKGTFCWSFSASHNNELVFETGDLKSQLIWFDRGGRQLGSIGEPGDYWHLELSPDGKRVAMEIRDRQANGNDIWLFDLLGGISTRFTFDPGWETQPIWSPDGSYIVYSSNQGGAVQIQEKMSNGTGNTQVLIKADAAASDWSRDGRFIVYETGEKGYDGLVRSTEFDYADLDFGRPVTIDDEDVDPGDPVSQVELFGPVTCLYPVRNFDEAVSLANATSYGLTGAIHTTNTHRIEEFIARYRAGLVSINGPTYGAGPHMPFGGVKNSGNGFREPGTEALDVYCEWKTVVVNHDPAKV
jgi:hypothetical protein